MPRRRIKRLYSTSPSSRSPRNHRLSGLIPIHAIKTSFQSRFLESQQPGKSSHFFAGLSQNLSSQQILRFSTPPIFFLSNPLTFPCTMIMGTGNDSCVSQTIDDAIPSGRGDCTKQGQNSSRRSKTRARSPPQLLTFSLSFGIRATR